MSKEMDQVVNSLMRDRPLVDARLQLIEAKREVEVARKQVSRATTMIRYIKNNYYDVFKEAHEHLEQQDTWTGGMK